MEFDINDLINLDPDLEGPALLNYKPLFGNGMQWKYWNSPQKLNKNKTSFKTMITNWPTVQLSKKFALAKLLMPFKNISINVSYFKCEYWWHLKDVIRNGNQGLTFYGKLLGFTNWSMDHLRPNCPPTSPNFPFSRSWLVSWKGNVAVNVQVTPQNTSCFRKR